MCVCAARGKRNEIIARHVSRANGTTTTTTGLENVSEIECARGCTVSFSSGVGCEEVCYNYSIAVIVWVLNESV